MKKILLSISLSIYVCAIDPIGLPPHMVNSSSGGVSFDVDNRHIKIPTSMDIDYTALSPILQAREAAALKAKQEAEALKAKKEAAALKEKQEAEALTVKKEAAALKAKQEAEALKAKKEAAALKEKQEAEALTVKKEAETVKVKQEVTSNLIKNQEVLETNNIQSNNKFDEIPLAKTYPLEEGQSYEPAVLGDL